MKASRYHQIHNPPRSLSPIAKNLRQEDIKSTFRREASAALSGLPHMLHAASGRFFQIRACRELKIFEKKSPGAICSVSFDVYEKSTGFPSFMNPLGGTAGRRLGKIEVSNFRYLDGDAISTSISFLLPRKMHPFVRRIAKHPPGSDDVAAILPQVASDFKRGVACSIMRQPRELGQPRQFNMHPLKKFMHKILG